MQLRDQHSGLAGSGQWGIFGGAKKPGESPFAGVKRELREELSLAISPEFIATVEDQEADILYEHYLYRCIINADPSALALREGQAAKFFHLADLDSLDKVEWFGRVYQDIIYKLLKK